MTWLPTASLGSNQLANGGLETLSDTSLVTGTDVGTVSTLDLGRRVRSGRVGALPPAVRVTLETGDPVTDAALGVVSITARVTGGRAPVRIHLYVNGDLAEAWNEPDGHFDLSLDEYGPGRHTVTARAVDALGRWAGASMIVACHVVGNASGE